MFRARLIPLDGSDPVELTRAVTVVGRKDSCDLRIDHKNISKQHCVLVKTDGLVLLRDLGSTNGTRVNGQRVRRAALVPNDIVAFAAAKYRVQFIKDDLSAADDDRTRHLSRLRADEPANPPDANEEPNAGRVEVHTHDLPDVYPPEPGEV